MIVRRANHDLTGGMEVGLDYVPEMVPVAGGVFSIIVSLLVQILLSVFLMILIIYFDSFSFAFASSILRFGVGVNRSLQACRSAILLCLIFYLSTKILIYVYFVEKVYLVRRSRKRRLRSKLYLFNMIGAIGPYVLLTGLSIGWRIHYINAQGACIIGVQKEVLWPLITWEIFINVYLTALFLGPMRDLYSIKARSSSKMRTMALRTFIGVAFTLTTSVVNLSILTSLNGEQGWVCLLICSTDVFFSVVVIHWVALSDEKPSKEESLPLTERIKKAVTPSKKPAPMPSVHVTPLPSPAIASNYKGFGCKFPWEVTSPVTTTISKGDVEPCEDGIILDTTQIRVQVRHERSEESLREITTRDMA